MGNSIKNILIGVFVLAAIGVIIFMLLFLHPSVGDNEKTLRVQFTDIDKVNVGTRVTFAGKPVGEVVSIRELPEARTNRIDNHGDVYVYELTLKVDSGVDVFNSDVITLRTSGLLGERNVEINPRPILPGQKLQKVENEVLYAAQTTNVEDTMQEIGELTKKFGVVLDDFHTVMEEIKQEKLIPNVKKVIDNVFDITTALNQPEKLRNTLDNISILSEKMNDSWVTVDESLNNFYNLTGRAHASWTTLDQTLENLHQISQHAHSSFYIVDQAMDGFRKTAKNTVAFTDKLNQLIDYTLEGKGTVGQLFVGNDFYLRLRSILSKGEVVMNDINTFGLLFHLNKHWQRLQARRQRLLEKLACPDEFAKYFNQEMDQISTSLSRVSIILNEAECYPHSLINHPEFTKRFSELLENVENMDENLKMYNEQIIDQESIRCSTQ